MKRESVVELWRDGAKPALFSARKGPGLNRGSPSVNVHQLKTYRGYLWVLWHGKHELHEIEKNIRAGGTTTRTFERACKLAVHELLIYKGRL